MRTQAQSRSLLAFYVALIIAELSSTFEATMTIAAIPTFVRLFNDPIGAGWLVTGFGLVAASAAAICGRLGDLYGRKPMMMILLTLCGIGSAISGLSTTLAGVLVGRAIQGVSGAIVPLCFGMVRENVRREQIPVGIGIISAIAIAGATLGLILGGVIVQFAGWQWIFHTSAALAFIGVLVVGLLIPASRPAGIGRQLDILGAVLFVPPIAGMLYAVGQARIWGWLDARTLGLLAGGVLVLAFWVWYELRQSDPLIDVRLLMQRQVCLTNLCLLVTSLGPFQMALVIAVLLQAPTWTNVGFGLAAGVAGGLQGLPGLVGVFGGPFSGRVAARSGGRPAMIYGAVLMVVSWAIVAVSHSSLVFLIVSIVLAGLGLAIVYAASSILIVEAAPADRTSEATGLSVVVRLAFTAVGAQILTFLLATSTISDASRGPGTFPTDMAFTIAFAYMTFMAGLCLVLALALPRRRPIAASGTDIGAVPSAADG